MRHRRLVEEADRQKIKVLLEKRNPAWKQTRLTALKMGSNAENSVKFIAESIGMSVPTVNRWFGQYRSDGLAAVLERGYGIGRPSHLDEEIEHYLMEGLENSRWNTAEQARQELEVRFERRFKYTTVWVWLKKMRRRSSGSSPQAQEPGQGCAGSHSHPIRPDPETTTSFSKNE